MGFCVKVSLFIFAFLEITFGASIFVCGILAVVLESAVIGQGFLTGVGCIAAGVPLFWAYKYKATCTRVMHIVAAAFVILGLLTYTQFVWIEAINIDKFATQGKDPDWCLDGCRLPDYGDVTQGQTGADASAGYFGDWNKNDGIEMPQLDCTSKMWTQNCSTNVGAVIVGVMALLTTWMVICTLIGSSCCSCGLLIGCLSEEEKPLTGGTMVAPIHNRSQFVFGQAQAAYPQQQYGQPPPQHFNNAQQPRHMEAVFPEHEEQLPNAPPSDYMTSDIEEEEAPAPALPAAVTPVSDPDQVLQEAARIHSAVSQRSTASSIKQQVNVEEG